MTLLTYSNYITGISKPADTDFVKLKLIIRGGGSVKKCKYCGWSSDKCKNPNSKNYDKFLDDIVKCKPLLIKDTRTKEGKKVD